jgi:hypothetical protein
MLALTLQVVSLEGIVLFSLRKRLIIELADERKTHVGYRTTEKGIRYLSVYSSLEDIAVFQQED